MPLPMPLPTARRLTIILSMLIVGFWALGAPSSAHHNPGHGGGPGGGGEDPPAPIDVGWIYSHGDTDPDRAIFRTDPEGTSTDEVIGAPADYGCELPECAPNSGAIGIPSHNPLDGDRWYVAWRWTSTDEIFPAVTGPYHTVAIEIDAVREGDTTGVRLTDNRGDCIYTSGFWPRWTTDGSGTPDSAITWVGAQWQDLDGDPLGVCESFVQAGIFRADLQFDANGAVIGADAPVLEVPVPVDATYNLSNIEGFSWSPDGSQVAYTEGVNMWIANVGDPVSSHSSILSGVNPSNLDWSPDQDPATAGLQTTIVFTGRTTSGKRKVGTWSVKPDGSGRTLLAAGRDAKNSSQTSITHTYPYWSPAGTHIAYTQNESAGVLGSTQTLRRMAADGSDNVEIAADEPGQDIRRILDWVDVD